MSNKRPALTMLLLAALTIYSFAISTAISISDQSLSTFEVATAPTTTANGTNYDHIIEQIKVKKQASKQQQQVNRSQSDRNVRNNSRHSLVAGKRNDISSRVNLNKIGSSSKVGPTITPDPFVLAQQEIRSMMGYNNTPPLFATITRDFYVDVARYHLGTKLTTIKAFDADGDQLEYSLQPASVRDASAYFSIDPNTGELRLANKPFIFHPNTTKRPPLDSETSTVQVEQLREERVADKIDEEEEDVEDVEESDVDKVDEDKNLYFLNVAANDGRYTSTIECQIHVTNSSSFSMFQSINSRVIDSTLEGNKRVNERLDDLIRKKTSEFYNGLHQVPTPVSTNSSPSTIVYPSFVNPGLVKPAHEQFSTAPARLDDEIIVTSTTIRPPDYITNLRPDAQAEHTPIPISKNLQYHTESVIVASQTSIAGLVLIIIVLIFYIVPNPVRLRKRLKNVELQHEHLSQQNSTGSSIICCSSTTSSMACHSHNPSWQSQITVGSDNQSSSFRDGPRSICRQSSLDSATTAANTVVSPYSMMLNQRLFNRVNNGSIANPVYLQNHQQDAFITGLPTQITSSLALPSNSSHTLIRDSAQTKHCDNIYYPIEHDYSTINPDTENPFNQLPQVSNNRFITHNTKDWTPELNSNHQMITQNPPQELIDRPIESPNSDSGSSIRSLIKFLSLPARHSAHTQNASQLLKLNDDADNDNDNNTDNEQQVVSKTIARASSISRERHDNQNWELERHKLKFLKPLDKGQFGMVWKCKLRKSFHNEITVAVKTLKNCATKDEREREELLAEIEIMKLVCNHPNVVKIFHCCTTDAIIAQNEPIIDKKPIYLVMEYVELGKLQSYLMESRANRQYATNTLYNCAPTSINEQNLTSRDLVKFIYHVAKGMEYISSQCIVHRDLASRNILVSSQKICKIGDFGMARHMQSFEGVYERHSRNTKVPVRWMAPEVLLNNKFTTESDVYSFGILMWEIVTLGSTPYKHLQTEQVIEKVARDGERPEKPEYCHSQLFEIMSKCWSQRPEERPTFKSLVKQLDEMLLSANNYIELDQYPDHNYYNIVDAPFELL